MIWCDIRLHLALAFAGFPLMRSRVAWLDGLTSVRRAYVPEEIRGMLVFRFSREATTRIEISRNYLYRMGVIVWKSADRPGGRREGVPLSLPRSRQSLP